jgi:phosphoglycerate dehydrogenase-like enzyme
MRARKILQTGAFNPEDLMRLQEAFDAAWKILEPDVEPSDHARSRDFLATVIVSAGNVSGLDADELAAVALRTVHAIRAGTQTIL